MKKIYLCIAVIFSCFILSCQKDEASIEEGKLEGDALGYISLYSQNGEKISIPAGFAVSLTNRDDNSNYSATPDADGKFVFSSLPMGDYQLKAELEGYASLDRAIYHLGGQSTSFIGSNSMLEISRSEVELVSYRYQNSGYYYEDLIINGMLKKDQDYNGEGVKVWFVFGNDEELSSSNYQYSQSEFVYEQNFEVTIQNGGLQKYKYVKAYTDNAMGYCTYFHQYCQSVTLGPASNLLSLE